MSSKAVKPKVSQRAIRGSEKKYRALFDNMVNGFAYHKVVFDDHGKPIDYIFLEINPAFEKLTGLKKQKVIGKRATEALPGIENDPADWIGIYGRVALTGEPARFENYSGNLKRWYSVSAYSSERGYFASVFEDITERKQKEEMLRQSEVKFRILVDNTYDMEFWIGPEGRYILASPSCKRITGYDPQNFMDDPGFRRKIVHPEDLPIYDKHLQEEGSTPGEIDFRIIRADGEVRWVSHGCRPIFDQGGRFLGIRGTNRDITERKHLEILNQTLNDINLIINSTLDSDEIMNRVVKEACKAIGSDSAAISLRKEGRWSVAYAYGFPSAILGAEIPDEENPHALLAIKTQQVIAVNDAFNDARVNREVMRKYDITSVMVIPLVVKSEAVGALFINRHKTPTPFTRSQIDFAEKLGSSLALSLQNTTLLKAEKKGKERFQLLSDTASKLLATDNPQGIVNELCQEVMAYLDCHVFFNYLVDEKNQRLHLNACAGIPEETAKEIEWLDYGVAVCGCAARDSCRIVAEDILNTADPRTDLVKSFGIKACACHPLLSAGRVIGTLSFGTRTRTTFTEEDLSLMKTVADQVAVAMEGARLIEALGRSRDELELRVRERTAQLAKANELLEKMFSSVDISLAYMDREFNFIRVNRAYAAADEREPDFYVGKNHFTLFPNEENERIFRKVVETGEPYSVYAKPFEYAEHPERGVTYWDWNLQAVKEVDGRVGGVVLSLMNVTERVRAQEALRAERQRFNDVLETLPAYVVLLTPDYHAIFANRVFRERFGESQGRRCFEFLFDRGEPCEDCETYTALKTMAPHQWEWTGPDGRIYSVFDFPFTDTDGSTLILEMGIDVTERNRAEQALREASLYTRNLIETSLDPLVTISADGKIMDVNSGTELTTGVPRDRLIGTDFSDYFTEPEKARQGYRKAFHEGFVRDYPLAIRHTSGRVTHVRYNASVYRDETGVVQGVFAAARDITELKRAEEELREKEKQIRFFATQSLTAHEAERRRIAAELHDSIASSLAGIKFKIEKTAQDVQQGLGNPKSLLELSSNVAQAIGEVRRIMADLRPSILDDLGILPALSWFCREYEKTYSHISVQKEIGISEDEISDSLKTAIFRLSQEALNNVAKHSGASLVDLSLRKVGERVELTIQDNGHGFESPGFARGFGLSTMRERVELSGGTFAVHSTAGKGTILRASWPLDL
jgi:PAS domain S-box-containing protein